MNRMLIITCPNCDLYGFEHYVNREGIAEFLLSVEDRFQLRAPNVRAVLVIPEDHPYYIREMEARNKRWSAQNWLRDKP